MNLKSENNKTKLDSKKDKIMTSVFDQTAVGICITNEDRRFEEVNQAYCDIYGYERDELIGKPFTIVVPENFKKHAEYLHDVFMDGEPELPVEWVVQRKNGDLITIVVTAALMTDEDGTKYKITTVTDVTNQKKAEELINRFGRIMSQSYDEIYIFDAITLKFIQVNESALNNLGYSLNEIRELTPIDINPKLSMENLESLMDLLRKGVEQFKIFETFQKRKDGSLYEVEVRLQYMDHENPPVFAVIVQEITEKKKLRQINQELKTAAIIQNRLMPDKMPNISGYNVAGISIPSKEVGGDYFDFQLTESENLAFCLGDVSGKGMPAALLMSNLQAIVRGQTMVNASPSQCMNMCNKLIHYNSPTNRFVSFFYGILNPESHEVISSNAGHNPPILIKSQGVFCHVPKGNMALGLTSKTQYSENRLLMERGDTFVLFSDGIIEAMTVKNEIYGEERMINIINVNKENSASVIAKKVIDDVYLFLNGAPQGDDLTILILKREK